MKALVLTAAALATLTAATTADARPLGGCAPWVCGANGPQLTGIARPALEAKWPVVNTVTLPSGEAVDLR